MQPQIQASARNHHGFMAIARYSRYSPRPGDIRLRLWDQTDSHPWPARKPCMPRTKCLPGTFGQRMTKDS